MKYLLKQLADFRDVTILIALCGCSDAAFAGQLNLPSGTYQVSDVAGEQVLMMAPDARLTRDQATPAPACTDLYAKLEQDRANIERCLGPTRPLNYCKLLEGGWRRVLLGIENEAMGTFSPDAEQHWSVTFAVRPIPGGALAEASTATGAPVQAFVGGQSQNMSLSGTRVDLAPNSWSKVIDRLPDAGVHPLLSPSHEQFKTRNRLLACDLLRGDAVLSTNVDVSYQASVVEDPGSVQPLWGLYQDLRNSQGRFPLRRDRLIAYGFDTTHFLFEQNNRAELDEVRNLVRIFVPGSETAGELTSYVNSFDLGKALPRKNFAVQAIWPVSLSGQEGTVTP